MVRYFLTIFFVFAFLKASAQTEIVIKNVNIITHENQFDPKLGYVTISGDQITNIVYGSEFEESDHKKMIDGNKMYLIPGLIDSHNHINVPLGLDEKTIEKKPHLVTEYQKQLPRSYLYFGYTSIIDLFTADSKVIEQFRSQPEHPDLFTCGGAVTELNGYPMNFLGEDKFKKTPNFIISKNSQNKYHKPQNSGRAAEKIIDKIIKNNGIFVKTYHEPGFDEKDKLPLPSITKMKEIIQAAHKNNLPVIIHANSEISQKFALEVGVDGIAHGLWNWNVTKETAEIPKNIRNILDQISLRKIAYQPTTQTIGGLVDLFDDHFLEHEDLPKVLPAEILSWFQSNSGKWFKSEIAAGNNSKKMNQVHQQSLASLNYLANQNAFLLFASDTPSAPTYANPPGLNGYLEMKNWQKAGVSLKKILEAATINNAKFFHLDKTLGSIAKNKVANLLLLKTNPLESIEAYNDIQFVILHGKIYDRESFAVKAKKSANEI